MGQKPRVTFLSFVLLGLSLPSCTVGGRFSASSPTNSTPTIPIVSSLAFQATYIGSTQAALGWTSSISNTANFTIAYQQGASAPANCTSGTIASPGVATASPITGLSAGTQYSFLLCANNSTGSVLGGMTVTLTTLASVNSNHPSICSTVQARYQQASGSITSSGVESSLDTSNIQAALNGCTAGKAVELALGAIDTSGDPYSAFVSGPLKVPAGVSLVVDSGVYLFASRTASVYDNPAGSGNCGIDSSSGNGCLPLITLKGPSAGGLYGPGTIDGQGGQDILNASGASLGYTWWGNSANAHTNNNEQNNPNLVESTNSTGAVVSNITIQNAPLLHLTMETAQNFTVWGVILNTPANTNSNTDNTAGIIFTSVNNGLIAYSYIQDGDDNIALNANAGSPTHDLTIIHNHFYWGHGMSIGSETAGGVSNIFIQDLSLDGTTWGLRIKSYEGAGGLVSNVQYQAVCIRGVEYPILIDPTYAAPTGSSIPQFQNILFNNIGILNGGTLELEGYSASYPLSATFNNVQTEDSNSLTVNASNASITLNDSSFSPSGMNVQITNQASSGAAAQNCSSAFVNFP